LKLLAHNDFGWTDREVKRATLHVRLMGWNHLSNNVIADLAGVTPPTVSAMREYLEGEGRIKRRQKLLGKDGKFYSTKNRELAA